MTGASADNRIERSKILIVDDREANLKAFRGSLQDMDIEIFTALNGEAALHLIVEYEFAVVVLDVQMPGMSGFEVAELMRGLGRSKHLPIIFVTAGNRDQKQVFQGYEAGAVDFLYKPFDPHILRSKIRAFVELDQKTKQLNHQMSCLKEAEGKLSHALHAAESASRAKSYFLANVSHEIRTPLSVILGYTDLLLDRDVPREVKQQYAATIKRNGEHLARLIDDILDLSKVEAGKLEIEKVDFSLRELVRTLQSSFEVKAKEKNLQFFVELDAAVPDTIESDPSRLRQILVNLIANAIKFTSQGSVSLTVRAENQRDGAAVLSFEVTDSGIGMTTEQAEKLFLPFSQADSSTTRLYGGTGLGLVLARQLAQQLGGDLQLKHSEKDRGSSFVARVSCRLLEKPLGTAHFAEESKVPLTESADEVVKVLLVEDNQDNRELMRHFLEKLRARVDLAVDGAEGVEKAIKGDYDLVLMDIQMPRLDGHGATRKLRSMGYTTPIIALTAHAMSEERTKCLLSGCNDHLTKPVRLKELQQKIHSYASRSL